MSGNSQHQNNVTNSKRSRTSNEGKAKPEAKLCPHFDLSVDLKQSLWMTLFQGLNGTDLSIIPDKLLLRQNELFCVECDDFVLHPEVDAVKVHAQYEQIRRGIANSSYNNSAFEILPVGKLGLCGMVNLGNTCFMGSILQVLLQIGSIRDYFLSGKHRAICVPAAKAVAASLKNPAEKNGTDTNGTRYAKLWSRPWSNNSKEIAMNFSSISASATSGDVPTCFGCELESLYAEVTCPPYQVGQPLIAHRILQNLWTYSPALAGYYQQDAQELYNALVNAVHAHVCSPLTLAVASSTTLSQSRSTSPVSFTTNNNNHSHENSGSVSLSQSEPSSPSGASQRDGTLACQCIVHRELGGVLRSQLTCSVCGNSSARFEPFFEIPLDLNHAQQPQQQSSGSSGVSIGEDQQQQQQQDESAVAQNEDDLLARLDAFVQPESIQGVQCTSCDNAPQDALKKLSLHVLPPTLSFHLKRFQSSLFTSMTTTTTSGGGNTQSTNNSGPTSRSNSALGMLLAPSGLQKNTSRVSFPIRGLNMKRYVSLSCACEDDANCDCFMYDLRAVVQHTGQLAGGHYIAFVRQESSGLWFELDDEDVSRVDENTVKEAEAYMLFYSKRSSSSSSSATL